MPLWSAPPSASQGDPKMGHAEMAAAKAASIASPNREPFQFLRDGHHLPVLPGELRQRWEGIGELVPGAGTDSTTRLSAV